MTKEELRKEAEEWLKKKNYTGGYIGYFASGYCKQAYIDSAEPREKHIAELKKQLDLKEKALSKAKKETKRIADRVNKDKRRLIRRKTELEQQIEEMKCCTNCKHSRTEYEHCKTDKHEKWEIKEK